MLAEDTAHDVWINGVVFLNIPDMEGGETSGHSNIRRVICESFLHIDAYGILGQTPLT